MAGDSSKRVAVVTGSCKSIGQAIALEFAKEGYCIAINGVDESAIDDAAKNIARAISGKDEDSRIISFAGDISSEEIAESLVEQTIRKYGRIDVLINNLELLVGPQRVNSTNNIEAEKPLSPYFTLEEFEFSDNSLNGIVPGIIFPTKNEQLGEIGNNNNDDTQKDMIPIKRIGRPREVAQVATFLASDKASYIAGTLVYVDGGLALNRPARFLEQDLGYD